MAIRNATFRFAVSGCLALALAVGIGRFAFTPLLPMMHGDGLLSVAEGGLIATVHFAGYLIGAVVATRLRASPATLFRISLLTIFVATLGMGLLDELTAWMILRFFAGIASAWILILVSDHLVAALRESVHTQAQGFIFSGVGLGIAVVGLICLVLSDGGVSSTGGWLVTGVASGILAISLSWKAAPAFPDSHARQCKNPVERTPLAWGPMIAYGAAGIGYIVPATYLPIMAHDLIDDPLVFGWSWPVFGCAAAVSTLLLARLFANFSNRQIWAISQTIMAIGICLPAVFQHFIAVVTCGICVGGTFMIVTMAGMKEAHRIAAPGDVGRHVAMLTASFATGQMLGPVLAGALYDDFGSFAGVLLSTAAALALSVILLHERHGYPTTPVSQTD